MAHRGSEEAVATGCFTVASCLPLPGATAGSERCEHVAIKLYHISRVPNRCQGMGCSGTHGRARGPLAGEGLAYAAVNLQHGAGDLGRAVRGEEERRLGDVVGEDARLEQIAAAVELLELLGRDAVRAGA